MEEKTHKDFEWRLTTAMGHFGNHRVDEIDARVADDFVEQKLVERESIEQAAAAGRPLLESYTAVVPGDSADHCVIDAARQLDQEQRPLDWRDCSAIRSSDAPTTHLAATYGVSDAPRSPGMAQDTTRRRT